MNNTLHTVTVEPNIYGVPQFYNKNEETRERTPFVFEMGQNVYINDIYNTTVFDELERVLKEKDIYCYVFAPRLIVERQFTRHLKIKTFKDIPITQWRQYIDYNTTAYYPVFTEIEARDFVDNKTKDGKTKIFTPICLEKIEYWAHLKNFVLLKTLRFSQIIDGKKWDNIINCETFITTDATANVKASEKIQVLSAKQIFQDFINAK